MNHSQTLLATSLSAAARALMAVALAGVLAAGCGTSTEDQGTASNKAAPAAPAKVAQAVTAASAPDARNDDHMANAVVTSKSAAAVDLKYDVLAKPEVGQTFEVELRFLPRLPADSLEAQIGDMPGLTLLGERTLKFVKVGTSQPYKARVPVRADAAGLYYLSVIVKMTTQLQSDTRAFSVPVVVGTAPAPARKPAPAKDATGRPIEPMPAKEG